MSTWILSSCWLKKATLQQEPQDYQMTKDELSELNANMQNLDALGGDNSNNNNKNTKKSTKNTQKSSTIINNDGLGGESEGSDIEDDNDQMADMDKFMEDYSDDDDDGMGEDEDDEEEVLTKYLTNSTAMNPDVIADDEYLQDDDEDAEENNINPNSSIFITGQTDPRQDECFIEVQVYDNENDGFYTHHDIQIPAPPITLAPLTMFNPHLDKTKCPSQIGAFLAVGMMSQGIQIWDLDVLHPVEPTIVLGGYDFASVANAPKPLKNAKKVVPKLKVGSHSDNVTSLSWSEASPDALLSASSDKTVKLWQISNQTCQHTFTHHTATVAVVQFNPTQPQYFLSAAENGHVVVVDLNSKAVVYQYKPAPTTTVAIPKPSMKKPTMKKPSPITLETAKWNNINPNLFYTTLSNGIVQCFDIRSTNNQPVWSLQASQTGKAIPSIAPSTFSETLFATVGEDGHVNIWDLPANHPHTVPQVNDGVVQPALLTSRNVNVGRLFSCSFDVNNPFVLGTGGDGGCPAIWDLMENMHVNKRYKNVVQQAGFGDQTLPDEYIKQQMAGIQSKGIGPGKLANDNDAGDYDSDDDFELDGEANGNDGQFFSDEESDGDMI